MPKYNKNGQIIPEDKDVNFGANTAEQNNTSLKNKENEKKLDDLYSRYDKATGIGKEEIAKQIYQTETGKGFTGSTKQIPLQRYEKKYDSTKGVRGNYVYEKPAEKVAPVQGVQNTKAPETTPELTALTPEVQNQINTSNEVVRQEQIAIKDGADKAREDIRKEENNLVNKAEEARQKYDMFARTVDAHYEDGLPRSIIQAWKNGRFGTPDSKDAKDIRNNLIANEIGTLAANIGSAFKNGETKEGLWTSSVRKNMEEADKRNNEKFETTMMNELSQLDLGSKDQIQLENHINQVMSDATLAAAAKHANNLEDTLGMWHLKEAMGAEWSKMSTKQKQNYLNAVNAFSNGDTASGQALMQTAFGDDHVADVYKKLLDYQAEQSKATAKLATTDAAFKPYQNSLSMLTQTANAVSGFIPFAGGSN